MDLDPRLVAGPVRNPARQQMVSAHPKVVGDAIMVQRLDVRINKQHFEFRFGGWIQRHRSFDIIRRES